MQRQEFSSTKTLGKAIEDLVENLGIARKIREYDAVVRWHEVVGDRIARVTEAVRIEKGILVVRVKNGPWRNELTLLKNEVIEKMNASLGETLVKDIKFV